MTDEDLIALIPPDDLRPFLKVKVQGSDYSYTGWIVMAGEKRSGAMRYVVEDAQGRLFIHNAQQIAGLA